MQVDPRAGEAAVDAGGRVADRAQPFAAESDRKGPFGDAEFSPDRGVAGDHEGAGRLPYRGPTSR